MSYRAMIPTVPSPRHLRRVVLAGALLLGVGAMAGCSNGRNIVTGCITPQHFEFTMLVKKSRPKNEPSGWWAVCIHALITQGDSEAKTVCKFEVGMPARNEDQGEISLEDAQEAASTMANRAIYKILSEAHPGEMLITHCRRFKELYRLMLREKIYGAEVGACGTKGVKTVHFNVPYQCD